MSLPSKTKLAFLSLLFASTVSCGGGASEEDALRDLERLELEPAAALLEAPKVELYASIGDLGGVTDCEDWTLDGANFEFMEEPNGRVLRIGRARPVRILIPIDLRFVNASEVTLRLINRAQAFGVVCSLMAQGEVISESSADVGTWKNQQEIVLSFSGGESSGRKIDHVA